MDLATQRGELFRRATLIDVDSNKRHVYTPKFVLSY